MGSGLRKHLNILDFTLMLLWRRRLKNLSVLLVFASVIFLVASFELVTQALTDTAALALRRIPEMKGWLFHPLTVGSRLCLVTGPSPFLKVF